MPVRSPFPGMDPWLEGHWGGVRHAILQYASDQIAEQLPSSLYATIGITEYWDFELGADAPPRSLGHIEVRTIGGREPLVTAIEVVGPTVKFDARNRRQYVRRRDEYYAAGVAVVEVDLLRAGEPLVDVPWDRLAAEAITPYKACVRRAPADGADLHVEYYPLPLRERLPRLRIPLRATDADAVLDLQLPIDRAYEIGRYGMRLDYASPPPGPPLSADDALWAAEQVRGRGA